MTNKISTNELITNISNIIKIDIINNNDNILNKYNTINSNINLIDQNTFKLFDNYFNRYISNNKYDELNKKYNDSFYEYFKETNFNNLNECIFKYLSFINIYINIDIDYIINETQKYKDKFDNHEYEDTLIPPDPPDPDNPIEYSNYDQFWAFESNEENYINDIIVPLENIIKTYNSSSQQAIDSLLYILDFSLETIQNIADCQKYLLYKDKYINNISEFDLYYQNLETIKKYSNKIYDNFLIAHNIVSKNPSLNNFELNKLIKIKILNDKQYNDIILENINTIENYLNNIYINET